MFWVFLPCGWRWDILQPHCLSPSGLWQLWMRFKSEAVMVNVVILSLRPLFLLNGHACKIDIHISMFLWWYLWCHSLHYVPIYISMVTITMCSIIGCHCNIRIIQIIIHKSIRLTACLQWAPFVECCFRPHVHGLPSAHDLLWLCHFSKHWYFDSIQFNSNLVGDFSPSEKYESKWEVFPGRGENKNVWNHHLEIVLHFP